MIDQRRGPVGVVPRREQPVPVVQQPVVKVAAAFGRLYVTGPNVHALKALRGAAWNDDRRAVELSLTLETLRAVRAKLGVTQERMIAFCTPEVLAWAKAAGASERMVLQLHEKLASGWRMALPWDDTRAGTPAPASAPERQVEYAPEGVRVWARRAPFDHQEVMASVGCGLDGAAFLCEMGTGKTRAGAESIRFKLEVGEIELAVVVAPKNVLNTWVNQLREWAPTLRAVRCAGTMKQRAKVIEAAARGELGERVVLLLNYEALSSAEVQEKDTAKEKRVAHVVEALLALMRARRVGFVLDEMHKVANPNALTTKAAMRLAQFARWRLGMTGTPVKSRTAEDVWSQWYVVDLGLTFGSNYVQFRREWYTDSFDGFSLDVQDGAFDEIGQRLRRRGVRYRKEDCLDLPPKLYVEEEVEMTAEQERAYVEMERDLLARLHGAGPGPGDGDDEEADPELATAATQLVAILRLTQITSGFVPAESGRLHRFAVNPKLERLEEIVRREIEGQQIITWAQYREDIRAIAERMADLNPLVVQGGQTDEERAQIEPLFQSGQRRWLVGNAAAGGVGLNLQAASLAVYYSQGYSLIDRLQSEDRCHRSGSEAFERVTYVDLLAKFRDGRPTVDHVVLGAIREKKAVADLVVDLRRAIGDRSV